jgi:acyl-CoA thioester hydrolase
MLKEQFNYEDHVRSEWIDYNGHMNDAAYAKAFSLAVDSFIEYIGLDSNARTRNAFTIFTLETHLCYLKEAHEGEQIHVTVQLIDDDNKRLHLFFVMKNRAGDMIATSEQMLMGMDTVQGRPAPFPSPIAALIEDLRNTHKHLEIPEQVGRRIGIKR